MMGMNDINWHDLQDAYGDAAPHVPIAASDSQQIAAYGLSVGSVVRTVVQTVSQPAAHETVLLFGRFVGTEVGLSLAR
jgi:hypothetical protein